MFLPWGVAAGDIKIPTDAFVCVFLRSVFANWIKTN